MRKRAKYAHVWPIDEKAAKPPEGWTGWPDGKKFALVLTHDVETAEGIDKCLKLVELDKNLGFRSSFNFVADEYRLFPELRLYLEQQGFEVGVHGLRHNVNLFKSKTTFQESAKRINQYLKDWQSVGFRAPSMYHNLDWIGDLDIQYDSSTFDTDPFEPQPDGVGTIFPFWVPRNNGQKGYIELPYTLPQDHALFVIMGEKNIDIWKKKLDWIAEHGGMALLITHPDYMNFSEKRKKEDEEYPVEYYKEFLEYVKDKYAGQYWNVLPKDLANFCTAERGNRQVWPEGFKNRVEYGLNRRKIRVCMLAYSFYELDTRIRNYADSLSDRGDEVDVIALRKKGLPKTENIKGVNVYRIQERVLNEKRKLSYLIRILRFFIKSVIFITKKDLKESYNLIHVHNVPDFLVFAAIVPKLNGAKVILDIHDPLPDFFADKFSIRVNSIVYKFLRLIEFASTKFADHVITVTDYWKDRIADRSSIPKEKVSVFINYPDLRIFNHKNLGNPRKEGDRFTLIYTGSLQKHYANENVIRSVELLRREIPSIRFLIYGIGTEIDKLKWIVKNSGLENHVSFEKLVVIEEIPKIIRQADIGVVLLKETSNYAQYALSVKLFEFIAMGLPVVATRTEAIGYYLDDSIVMFSDSNDPADIANCIKELYLNKAKRERLITNGLRYIAKNNWEANKVRYFRLIDSLSA